MTGYYIESPGNPPLRYCQISKPELFCEKSQWFEVVNYFHKNFYINAISNNSYCSYSRAAHKPLLELLACRKTSLMQSGYATIYYKPQKQLAYGLLLCLFRNTANLNVLL